MNVDSHRWLVVAVCTESGCEPGAGLPVRLLRVYILSCPHERGSSGNVTKDAGLLLSLGKCKNATEAEPEDDAVNKSHDGRRPRPPRPTPLPISRGVVLHLIAPKHCTRRRGE